MSSFPHSPAELKALTEVAVRAAKDSQDKRAALLAKNKESARSHLLAMQLLLSKRALPQ